MPHGTAVPVTGSRKISRCLSLTALVSLSETRVLMVRFSGGVYGVMKTRRGHSSWLGLGLGLGFALAPSPSPSP